MFSNVVALTLIALLALPVAHASPSSSTVIDFSLLESAPSPPHDLDITQDHPFTSYDIADNTSWVITTWEGISPPVWVHESRLPDYNSPISFNETRSGPEARAEQPNFIRVAAGEPSKEKGSESCLDPDHATEKTCVNLQVLTRASHPQFSWDIAQEGPSGHAALFAHLHALCGTTPRYTIYEQSGCINNLKGALSFSYKSF